MGTDIEPPAGIEVIDLSCCTVLPGFIDAHTHLTGRTIGEGENWQDASVRDLPQEGAIRGVRNARLTLEAGFTTVRNVGANHYSDIALRDMINEGVVPGPRMLVAGHALGITGGHCDTNGYRPGVLDPQPGMGVADGPWAIVREVRIQVKRGADVIKFCATGGVLSEGDPVGIQQYTAEEMRALVDETHLTDRKVRRGGLPARHTGARVRPDGRERHEADAGDRRRDERCRRSARPGGRDRHARGRARRRHRGGRR